MRRLLAGVVLLSLFCSTTTSNKLPRQVAFTEKEILNELDLAFEGKPGKYFPEGQGNFIRYNFFLDLEHGYCVTAGNRIHLYADSTRWAIVFEKNGYQNRASDAEIELDYFGNCINYPVETFSGTNYISNSKNVILISAEEYDRITNKKGKDMEGFELIDPAAKFVLVRDKKIKIEQDSSKYIQLGIKPRTEANPQHLVGFDDLIRYLNETDPKVINATEQEIKKHIPSDLHKIMTIDKFHFESIYNKGNLPSTLETYQLIAKVLLKGDSSLWKPTQKANNHWSHWESGNL